MTEEIPGGRVARVAPLVGLAGRTAGEAVVAALRNQRRGVKAADRHTRNAERYAEQLGRSRGVLMKAGQILSFVTFSTAVEDEYRGIYQQALARLQDSAPPMPAELAVRTLTEELGRSPGEVFTEFDPQPVAAASIGQVHKARLPDGRAVAVKIQYPGVDRAIRADLKNTELLATFFRLLAGMAPGLTNMDLRAMAAEVSERIGEEIDYLTEAANQREFADFYRGHPFIRVPEVLDELTTRRVLTMEFVEGQRYAEALRAGQDLRDRWSEAIFRFTAGNLRLLRAFNADPHPGNYLFHPDGTVTFLDFGCVKRFRPEQVRTMQAIIRATAARDPEAILREAAEGGFVDLADPPDAGELLAWFVDSLAPLVGPQPYTYTEEFARTVVNAEFSPNGPHARVVRKLTTRSDYLFISRIDTGMTAVLGALGGTGPWAAIKDEWDNGGPPATKYGELDFEFRGVRT
ncbi:AarF/ABC1/UbiB kinase family protein [Pseudonocardia eucalypti]|uniref:AarF/ABC1/UbiB kinase family protein n=1 Tax=Pseudonocardia eucalypti TaxID=648755 RepID=A0ABP9QYZ8_9PSEU|nr:putative unusual protein kinase regulating ubiquinone biosynthesis (AarF/ABC1/UbiB family) [Pseudonocardia eucalypti]